MSRFESEHGNLERKQFSLAETEQITPEHFLVSAISQKMEGKMVWILPDSESCQREKKSEQYHVGIPYIPEK